VLFVPALHAVYYDNGGLIRTSILKRGLGQKQVHKPPPFIDIQQVKHSTVIDKALFGGVIFPHFGHFLLESLSRLWPLAVSDMEKEMFECDVLYCTPRYQTGTITYSVTKVKQTIFENLNINIKPNIRILNQPVLIHKLIIPDQAIILESEIYPIFRTLLKTAGDRIIRTNSQSRKDEYKDKVYLSRSSLSFLQRNCVNEKKLENILKDHGFGIFHIHEFSIADQIGLLNNAEIIVGPDGSSFHAMLLSETSRKAILYLVCGEPESTYVGIDRICEVDSKYINCMYPHPLCLKSHRPKDTIIDIPKACQGIMQYL
jgi:capsular polysaccharide biosynthesis protein